ncbi:MAG: hypothetical protein ACFB9M_12250 [Myxococcota bacterium]
MPQCPHCSAQFEDGLGHICPVCAQDVLLPPAQRGAPVPFRSNGRTDAPFAGMTPPPLPPVKRSTRRVVSSAGPSSSARGSGLPHSDVADNGWGTQPDAEGWLASEQVTPPPLVRKKRKTPEPEPAPAVAKMLEDLEAQKDPTISVSIPKGETIAKAEIAAPPPPKPKRRVPERLVMAVLVLLVVTGLAAVYYATRAEPEPVVQVDPELQAEVNKRRLAMRELERGHTFVLEGKTKASEAITAYQEALRLDPTLSAAVRGIAISLAAQGKGPEAVTQYRRYLEMEPDADDADQVRRIIRKFERAQRRRRR